MLSLHSRRLNARQIRLYDYAVARLLRGLSENLLARIESDTDLVLTIRPSLVLHFQHLWEQDTDHAAFWETAVAIARSPKIPEIGKLIGPSIAAELMAEAIDFEWLANEFDTSDSDEQQAAIGAVINHLRGAILALDYPVVGPRAAPLASFVEVISRSLRKESIFSLCPLLMKVCDHAGQLPTDELVAAGTAARRFLEFAWAQSPPNVWLAGNAIEAVCKTAASDILATTKLLRHIIEPSQLAEWGHEELPRLSRHISALFLLAPEFVSDVYATAFSYQEESDEKTMMGTLVVPMTSTKRQDYDMALYQLAEIYPEFLQAAPAIATRTLVRVLESYVETKNTYGRERPATGQFEFYGVSVALRSDGSWIWDDHTPVHEEPLQMLSAFMEHLKQISETTARKTERRLILLDLARENPVAIVWKRLLSCAVTVPETLGREIRSMLWAEPILLLADTNYAAGDLLRVLFPRLGKKDRARIEKAILLLPDHVPSELRDRAMRQRDRLLGCLSQEHLALAKTKRAVTLLAESDSSAANAPAVGLTGFTLEPDSNNSWLSEEGVDTDDPDNQRISELVTPLEQLHKTYDNSTPPSELAEDMRDATESLLSALLDGSTAGAHPKQLDHAWGHLAGACKVMARIECLNCESDIGALVRRAILAASTCPFPEYVAWLDSQFQENPSWGSPAARVDVAVGAMLLCRHPSCLGSDLFEAIDRLSRDAVAAVRFQVSWHLSLLFHSAPALMWSIAERLSHEEQNRGVLWGTLHGVGVMLRLGTDSDVPRIAALVREIHGRFASDASAKTLRRNCAGFLCDLYVWRGEGSSREIVDQFVADPSRFYEETSQLVSHLRGAIAYNPPEPTASADSIRQRAITLASNALNNTILSINGIQRSRGEIPFAQWSKDEQELAQKLYTLIDHIGMQVYFASGTFDERQHGRSPNESEESMRRRKQRFLDELGPTIECLAQNGRAGLSYHLLEMLESFISIAPKAVFLLIGHVAMSGAAASGFQFDSMSADKMVEIVSKYLTELRGVLRDSQCRKVLIEVLDVFVKAGWPNAVRLTYRLNEISR